jgi:glycosyltransferase involved in cell wall biosynthesis
VKATKISIIVPVYNTEKYLKKCLNALVEQTFEDIEIICIDDGSTDGSLAILREYERKDARVKVISQENCGEGASRNVGLAAAHGEYIMFCDSDDWYEPQMCRRMVETLEQESVDLVMCNTNLIYATVNEGYKRYAFPFNSGKHSMDDSIRIRINAWVWNKIFRSDVIEKFAIFFPEIVRCGDFPFVQEYCAIANDIFCLDENLINYVHRGNSLMGTYYSPMCSREYVFAGVLALSHLLEFLKEKDLLATQINYFAQILFNGICFAWESIGIPWEREFFDMTKDLIKQSGVVKYETR